MTKGLRITWINSPRARSPGKLESYWSRTMVTNEPIPMQPEGDNLFDRVVSILEQTRSNAVRAVNNNMVIALLADWPGNRTGNSGRG